MTIVASVHIACLDSEHEQASHTHGRNCSSFRTEAHHVHACSHLLALGGMPPTCRGEILHTRQDDDTIIGWNLFNEPRCNCAPTVIDPNSGAITGENSGSDCSGITQCTADMKVSENPAYMSQADNMPCPARNCSFTLYADCHVTCELQGSTGIVVHRLSARYRP